MAMTVLASNITQNLGIVYPVLMVGTVPGPASYTAGGIALDFTADFGSQAEPIAVFAYEQQATSTLTHDAKFDSTADKLVVYDAGTTSESSGNLSAFTFVVLAVSLT